jgi:2-C-methyl-D-erythritol 2,4-cyclodiphosphate synthase
MKQTIASVMSVREEDISIKATTTEQLGFVGRKEGISAYAVALIYGVADHTYKISPREI